VLATVVLVGVSAAVSAVEITISCGAVGQERKLCEQETAAWATRTGNTVHVATPPNKTNERYFQYLLDLGAGKSDVDVYQIDVIWPGLLAKFFVDLNKYIPKDTVSQHFQEIIANNTVDGRLVGMPWYTDVGLLYYRKDLLQQYGVDVPQTWAQLTDDALYIQQREREKSGNEDFWGFVFQGAPYEGLTVDALEWINSHGGGELVGKDGHIDLNDARAAVALSQAGGWIGTIAPKRVTSFAEEDARTLFQSGHAVFMRNWPYAWSLLNGDGSPVAGKVGVAPLPSGGVHAGRHTGVLGGWQLAVSKFSKHPDVAADLVAYLTSREVQKRRAIDGSYAPTIRDLYQDPDVTAANPLFGILPPVLKNAVARPSGPTGESYMAVSTRFWEAVTRVLQGRSSAQDAVAALKDQLRLVRANAGGKW